MVSHTLKSVIGGHLQSLSTMDTSQCTQMRYPRHDSKSFNVITACEQTLKVEVGILFLSPNQYPSITLLPLVCVTSAHTPCNYGSPYQGYLRLCLFFATQQRCQFSAKPCLNQGVLEERSGNKEGVIADIVSIKALLYRSIWIVGHCSSAKITGMLEIFFLPHTLSRFIHT